MVLAARKIPFQIIDIADSFDVKEKMRSIVQDSKALPPQLVIGSQYCGDFNDFDIAVEDESLEEFFSVCVVPIFV